MSRLFSKFQVRYGHKWTSAMPSPELIELAVVEWGEILAGLSPEQVRHGLDGWREAWPPSAPEFRAACKGLDLAPCHRPFVPRLQKARDVDLGRHALAEICKALR